jgi:outer membrane immunogenic protein
VQPPSDIMHPAVRQGMIGLHAGLQYHIRNGNPVGVVISIEVAYGIPTSPSSGSVACVFDPTQFCRTRIDNVFTAGGRLGLAYDRFMLFGAGGYARADVSSENFTAAAGCSAALCDRVSTPGWYAGAGLEYALTRGSVVDVLLGIDWQHIKFDTARHVLPAGAVTINSRDVDSSADVVRARLSLKFNPAGNGTNGDRIDW